MNRYLMERRRFLKTNTGLMPEITINIRNAERFGKFKY